MAGSAEAVIPGHKGLSDEGFDQELDGGFTVAQADGRVTGARRLLVSTGLAAISALAVSPQLVARSAILGTLGLKPVAHPLGVGEYTAGSMGLTAGPGVWVAGNLADLTAAVPGSVGSGALAAAAIEADLIAEETRQTVAAARRRPQDPIRS